MTACTLCDLPTPDPPVTDGAVAGSFCCRGCLEVARTLGPDADAAAAREELGSPPPETVAGETAYLAVDGMHCATCEAFLESRAAAAEGVRAAEASYAAGLMKLVYDPTTLDEAALPALVDGLGYRARLADTDGPGDTERVGRLLVGGFFGMMSMCWYVLFLYPTYLGFPPEALLLDVTSLEGRYLLWNVWLMTTIVLGYTGAPILRGAYVSLRASRPNMDLLVALAATTAYVYSTAVLVTGGVDVYFDISTVIVLVVSVGTYYEARLRERAAGTLTALTEERVDEARRRTAEGVETVSLAALVSGDELVVRPGERVPVDGTVVEGTAACDEALVTGESLPVRRGPGDEAVGGALVTDGALVVRVGADATSTLDRLVGTLWDIQSTRPGAQRLADRLAAVFVPLVLALAALAFVWQLFAGVGPTAAFLTALAVLVVSCPCALGLATPLAVASGVREALDRGVVVTDGSVFEHAPAVDVVALDKTGTLTTGRMRLLDHSAEALARAAAVEQFSEHPFAAAVTDAAPAPTATVTDFTRHPGRGVSALVDGERVLVGRAALFASEGVDVPSALRERCASAEAAGHVPALVGWDGAARGVLVAGDEPRPGWEAVVSTLAEGRRVVVISGDSEAATGAFREHPDVDQVFAGVPPEAKAEVVARLRREGRVAMVGDGSNDAPALAAADLGIALESGTRLAADAADVVVTTDDLRTVPVVFALTRTTRRRVRENLAWAFCYNAIAVPLAVVGLINPLFAAVAMATSSLLVVANSARPFPSRSADDAHQRPTPRPTNATPQTDD
jgi:Cu2+-exporting ATPase